MARLICRQVAHSRYTRAVRKASFDCGLDEVRCDEGERDRHVDLPEATALALRNAHSVGGRASHELVEPAASVSNRRDQQRAVLGADGSGILGSAGLRHEKEKRLKRNGLVSELLASQLLAALQPRGYR